MAHSASLWTAKYPKSVPTEIDSEIAKYSSLVDIIDETAARFTLKPAFSNMGVVCSFSEINRQAEAFAAFLQTELKMQKGDRIGLQMPNLLQYPVALFGALKAGLMVVNTNPLYTEREMLHQYNDAGCRTVVIVANFANHLEKILPQTKIEHVIVTEIGDLLGFPKSLLVNTVIRYVKKMVPHYSLPDAISFNDVLAKGATLKYRRPQLTHDDIAFLQYTGGTTGVSKGAMLTHLNMIANTLQMKAWMRPKLLEGQEVAICALPLYHIFALTLNALALGSLGSHNVLITNPRDLPALFKVIKATHPTVMNGVNTLFNSMMNHSLFKTLDLAKMKVSVAGGMALQKAVAERWEKLTGTRIIEGYGLTETSPVVSCNPIDGTDRVGTIGLPMPSTLVKIVDESGQELPDGESGELCVHGPQVMKGYWQRPDETAKVMMTGDWIRTGDMATHDGSGFFKIVDRKKDMIIVSGFNVYPNEVEDVIAAHPKVLEVAAVGIPSEHSGETVKIFVVKKDASLTAEELKTFARESLTSYKVPREIEFRKELPKTNVGKILRRALKEEGTKS